MGKAEKEQLNRALNSQLNTVHETLQVLDQAPPSSVEKISWNQVVQMGEQLSKQASIVGMLWTGEAPEAKPIEETMGSYINVLQGFLLLSHGSSVGAGPTLSSSIHESVKLVVDSSFKLLMESVSLYGSRNKDQRNLIPQFVGAVWEACSALKKAPATNITAIGRAMTQVAVSVKDVLREMKELKPASADASEETKSQEDDNLSEDDLGNDLSAEEMKVAELATTVVSATLVTIKELIRAITGLLKLENPEDNSKFVDSLEKLLKLCKGVGVQIDELGACLYPPQEISAIEAALEKISSSMDEVQLEVDGFKCPSESFLEACNGLRTSIKQMVSHLDCNNTNEIVEKLENALIN